MVVHIVIMNFNWYIYGISESISLQNLFGEDKIHVVLLFL
jgi:hypothetical protein